MLRDFTADRRVLILAAMALVVGTAGAGAAWALSRLINKVLGMVSRADALRWLGDEDSHERLLREQVAGQQLVLGYDDELAGHLADRMTATDIGRVPILSCESGELVGLVARRDLLRVRANAMRHEREREALIRVLPRRAPES